MIPLSVCIPTYNRASYLANALKSVFAQPAVSRGEVEVLVCDNASPDDTETVASQYLKYKNFKYIKNPQNIGFDGNMQKAFACAGGRYCLAMGDDDIMLEGALDYLLEKIKTDFDFYLLSFGICYDGTKHTDSFVYLKNVKDGAVFDMGKKEDILKYLKSVKFNAGLFGYIGGFAVKRDVWNQIPLNPKVMGSGWIHIYNMWYLKNFGCKFCFLERPLINMRMQNDEIIKRKGWVSRLLMEYKGLYELSAMLFDKDEELRLAFLSVVKDYLPPYSIPPLFAVPSSQKKAFEELVAYARLYPYPQKFKDSLTSPLRLNPLYFVRAFLNMRCMRGVKKAVLKLRGLL